MTAATTTAKWNSPSGPGNFPGQWMEMKQDRGRNAGRYDNPRWPQPAVPGMGRIVVVPHHNHRMSHTRPRLRSSTYFITNLDLKEAASASQRLCDLFKTGTGTPRKVRSAPRGGPLRGFSMFHVKQGWQAVTRFGSEVPS